MGDSSVGAFPLGALADLRRRFLTDHSGTLYCPRFFLVDLFKHKERIVQATALKEDALLECLHELLARIHFVTLLHFRMRK
jgi:hypothetical protein